MPVKLIEWMNAGHQPTLAPRFMEPATKGYWLAGGMIGEPRIGGDGRQLLVERPNIHGMVAKMPLESNDHGSPDTDEADPRPDGPDVPEFQPINDGSVEYVPSITDWVEEESRIQQRLNQLFIGSIPGTPVLLDCERLFPYHHPAAAMWFRSAAAAANRMLGNWSFWRLPWTWEGGSLAKRPIFSSEDHYWWWLDREMGAAIASQSSISTPLYFTRDTDVNNPASGRDLARHDRNLRWAKRVSLRFGLPVTVIVRLTSTDNDPVPSDTHESLVSEVESQLTDVPWSIAVWDAPAFGPSRGSRFASWEDDRRDLAEQRFLPVARQLELVPPSDVPGRR